MAVTPLCVLCEGVVVLTKCDLGQVQTVDPGDLAKGVGSVQDHHETDRTPRPGGEHAHIFDVYIRCHTNLTKHIEQKKKDIFSF